jgi:hypothetical protein
MPRLPQATTSASVKDAHALLIQRIITNKPHHMHGWHVADCLDFEDRATHLQRLLEAVEHYVSAVMEDTKAHANIHVDTDVGGCISDMKGDVVGTLLNCAEDLAGGIGRAA